LKAATAPPFIGGVRRGRAGQRSVVETERRPGLAMPALSACSCDRMAARCRVRRRPSAGCWGLIVPAAARAALSMKAAPVGATSNIGGVFRKKATTSPATERDGGEAVQDGANPVGMRRPTRQCRQDRDVPENLSPHSTNVRRAARESRRAPAGIRPVDSRRHFYAGLGG
jgi:hypothetical protein